MNAIIIEQNPEATRMAFEVNQNAFINRIRLARAKVASPSIDEPPKAPLIVEFSFKSKPLSAPPSVVRLEIAFRMAGMRKKSASEERKPEPVVLVECAFEMEYVLREGFGITQDHVNAFKDGNAIFNAWPYFREYLQNNLQRMGLPPLTAPFLRLQPKPIARKREANAREGKADRPAQNRQRK